MSQLKPNSVIGIPSSAKPIIEAAYLSEAVMIAGTAAGGTVTFAKANFPHQQIDWHPAGIVITLPSDGGTNKRSSFVPFSNIKNLLLAQD